MATTTLTDIQCSLIHRPIMFDDLTTMADVGSGQCFRVKVPVRLSSGDALTCDGTLTTGVQPKLELSLPSMPDASCPEILLDSDSSIYGTLDDKRTFRATIELLVVGSDPNGATAHANAELADLALNTANSPEIHQPRKWTFGLTNVFLSIGDERVAHKVEGADGMTAFLKRVKFNVGGRQWMLTDISPIVAGVETVEAMSESLGTGLLETDVVDDKECADVSVMADDIATLTSLATGRDVRWYARIIAGQGAGFHYFKRTVGGYPYGRWASPPIDNGDNGALRAFLESCFDPLRKDRSWFYTTLDYFLCARLDWALQVRSTILNLLLDRISTKVVAGDRGDEIHEDIPASVEQTQFQKHLHAVLKTLPSWTCKRTLAIVAQIKKWNSTPSFPASVAKACQKLELPGPAKGFVGPRHKLMHVGELAPPKGISVWQYATELECLVLMMILRLLGYQDAFYHAHNRSNRITLRDLRPNLRATRH